jgi:hypothetical protein
LVLIAGAAATTRAAAAQTASISASFSPERLGAPTAIAFGFEIHGEGEAIPSALTGIDFHYPNDLGLGTSGLGLATCDPKRLAAHGPKVCPPNSIMGRGRALAKFQASPEVSKETAALALVAGPPQHGYIRMLVSASGSAPVAARILMETLLVPGQLRMKVPLVPGVPEGPDVAVVQAYVTIGGRLTYYRRAHGRRIAYHPVGVSLPRHCPRGGFKFSAAFSFLDGTSTQARATVPCPRR